MQPHDGTLWLAWPDVQVARSIVRRDRVCNRTLSLSDQTPLCPSPVKVQKGSKRVLSDRTRSVTPDRTCLRVRSLSALVFQINRCHRPDASSHIDRRVRSVRKMLSWHLTVEIDYGEYKYIPNPSIWGLLLVCSAEKHLLYARKCKSSSEDWDLRIQD
jgi:hypothetical protein